MLADKLKDHFTHYYNLGKKNLHNLFFLEKQNINIANLVGLEINPEYIKLLKINAKNEIENFAVAKLPNDVLVKNEIKNASALGGVLKNLIKQGHVKTKNIAFCIPRSSAIIKHISINKNLRADEIESRVWLEANKLFPDLIGDIFLDFFPVGIAEQDATRQEFTLVACRKDQLQPYLTLMHQADLNAKTVDLNSYALERALNIILKNEPDYKTVALLNINFSLITLIVIDENKLVYTHEITPDLPHGDAENSTDFKNSLSLHLRHTMQFFYSSRPSVRLQKVLVSGDCAATIPNLAEFIQKETNKETALANPFKNMSLSANVDQETLKHYAPALMLCCGLTATQIS
ncbi:MAG: pilus assembly protein PilM [Gammaproteobacteria bacterium]|nr:pilus assembly protein PilM [Gammaproteobacteria bacterium]